MNDEQSTIFSVFRRKSICFTKWMGLVSQFHDQSKTYPCEGKCVEENVQCWMKPKLDEWVSEKPDERLGWHEFSAIFVRFRALICRGKYSFRRNSHQLTQWWQKMKVIWKVGTKKGEQRMWRNFWDVELYYFCHHFPSS